MGTKKKGGAGGEQAGAKAGEPADPVQEAFRAAKKASEEHEAAERASSETREPDPPLPPIRFDREYLLKNFTQPEPPRVPFDPSNPVHGLPPVGDYATALFHAERWAENAAEQSGRESDRMVATILSALSQIVHDVHGNRERDAQDKRAKRALSKPHRWAQSWHREHPGPITPATMVELFGGSVAGGEERRPAYAGSSPFPEQHEVAASLLLLAEVPPESPDTIEASVFNRARGIAGAIAVGLRYLPHSQNADAIMAGVGKAARRQLKKQCRKGKPKPAVANLEPEALVRAAVRAAGMSPDEAKNLFGYIDQDRKRTLERQGTDGVSKAEPDDAGNKGDENV